MVLNYSHRPVYTAHTSDDNLVRPMRMANGCLVEGFNEMNGEGYWRPWHVSQGEVEWSFGCWRDKFERCNSPELTSKDIVDRLPSDPFGMDIQTTFTALAGWFDCEACIRRNGGWDCHENYGLSARWDFIWKNALEFQAFPSDVQHHSENSIMGTGSCSKFQVFDEVSWSTHSFPRTSQFDMNSTVARKENQYEEAREVIGCPLAPYNLGFQQACSMGDIVNFDNLSTNCSSELQNGGKMDGLADPGGLPHEVLPYILGHLGLKDLLSLEMVCKSLRSAVQRDLRHTLCWMSIHIDKPLNETVTDDILVRLASRADGKLRCLSLVECPKITDDGLKRILETNSGLTKLSVPGCMKLGIEGIVNNLKMYRSSENFRGLEQLRVGGRSGITHEYYEELKLSLGVNAQKLESYQNSHFYHRGNFYLPFDDDRPLDIEMCPKCETFRLVYDCPKETCRAKEKTGEVCRACTLCIPWCSRCGRCVNDMEYEETFCLELQCADCGEQPNYVNRLVETSYNSSG